MPDFELRNTLDIGRLAVVVQVAGHLPTVVEDSDLSLLVVVGVEKGALGEDWVSIFKVLIAPYHHRVDFVLVDRCDAKL